MKLFLATPVYGQMVTMQYHVSVLRFANEYQGGLMSVPHSSSAVHSARNVLAAMFLESDSDALLFVDADQQFTPETVYHLINAKKDVVGVACARKILDWKLLQAAAERGEKDLEPWGYTLNVELGGRDTFAIDEDGCIEVPAIGTGMMLIQRHVLEQMSAWYQDLIHTRDIPTPEGGKVRRICGLFTPYVKDGRERADDFAFCERWREMGGKVHVSYHAEMGHVGPHTFRASLKRLAAK